MSVSNTNTTNTNNTNNNNDTSHMIQMPVPSRFGSNHAIHGTLNGTGKIEHYQVYRHPYTFINNNIRNKNNINNNNINNGKEIVVAHIKFGHALNGHDGIVHGGILSLMYDDVFGFAAAAAVDDLHVTVYTAYVKVDFRRPLPESSYVHLRVGRFI